jgi:hypothetical protein
MHLIVSRFLREKKRRRFPWHFLFFFRRVQRPTRRDRPEATAVMPVSVGGRWPRAGDR